MHAREKRESARKADNYEQYFARDFKSFDGGEYNNVIYKSPMKIDKCRFSVSAALVANQEVAISKNFLMPEIYN